MKPSDIDIYGLKIKNVSYDSMLDYISDAINKGEKKNITYANANTINWLFRNNQIEGKLNSFDIVHHDGIGIYLASKILYGSKGFSERVTGSDFYPLLASEASKNYWKIFFLGHDEKTLSKIEPVYPKLNICGYNEGYNFDNNEVIKKINLHNPDILIVGLGAPKQENWILENKDRLNYRVCIAVGDGIKVFSKTKARGPSFLRKIGFEWLFRAIVNPLKYGKRYLIGNPLFLYRIIKLKMTKFVK